MRTGNGRTQLIQNNGELAFLPPFKISFQWFAASHVMCLFNDRFIGDASRRDLLDLDRQRVDNESFTREEEVGPDRRERRQASLLYAQYAHLDTEDFAIHGTVRADQPWWINLRTALTSHIFATIDTAVLPGLHILEPDEFDAEGNWIPARRQVWVDRLREVFGREILTMDDSTSLVI